MGGGVNSDRYSTSEKNAIYWLHFIITPLRSLDNDSELIIISWSFSSCTAFLLGKHIFFKTLSNWIARRLDGILNNKRHSTQRHVMFPSVHQRAQNLYTCRVHLEYEILGRYEFFQFDFNQLNSSITMTWYRQVKYNRISKLFSKCDVWTIIILLHLTFGAGLLFVLIFNRKRIRKPFHTCLKRKILVNTYRILIRIGIFSFWFMWISAQLTKVYKRNIRIFFQTYTIRYSIDLYRPGEAFPVSCDKCEPG